MGMLTDNLNEVRTRVTAACLRSGRDPREVTLIAVSKTKPVPMLEEVYAQGVRDFGENRPQEMRDKAAELPADIRWHMIGRLQTNKVKYVVPRAVLIHSVDSLHLAEAIDKEAAKAGVTANILIEVNIAGEASKGGIAPEETEGFARELAALPNLKVNGLMTIAPIVENGEENRAYFRQMRELLVDIRDKNIDNIFMRSLSMGMTGDFETAIEEGATLVRVGTGIFGGRS